jgi:glycosyltransferase involved in cell wall biosynthesis
VDVARINREADQAVEIPAKAHPLLVAVGRLDPQKNYSLLFQAIKRVIDERPVTLYILGEGSEYPRLESLSESLGLESHIRLLGFQRNPYAYMKQADLFVLSSNYEGFANVIVEAMAAGTPVVATDCPYGPSEILTDREYGKLVPPGDAEALAQAILSSLKSPKHNRAAITQHAQRFSVEHIVPQYAQLFSELLEGQGAR